MAQDAELRLKVGLDLGYFKQQLTGLGSAAAGYKLPINIQIQRRELNAELDNLQRAIKNRKYRIEVGGNLGALPKQITALKNQLATFENTKIDVGIGVVQSLSKRDGEKIKAQLRASVLGGSKKIFVPVSIKSSVTKQSVEDFTNAVKSKLSNIKVAVKADLQGGVQGVNAELRQAILGDGDKILAPVSITPSITQDDVTDFTKKVKAKLSGITVKVKAELETAAVKGGAKSKAEIDTEVLRGLEAISKMGATRMGGGQVTEAARREQLKQRLSTGEFDIGQLREIGSQLGLKNVGRFRNVQNLIEKIASEASVEMIKKYLDPQAVMRSPNRGPLVTVLDTFARGVANMLGLDLRAGLEQARQKRLPPAIDWPAQVPGRTPPIGPSSSGRALPFRPDPKLLAGEVGPALAGLLPSLTLKSKLKADFEAFMGLGGGPPSAGQRPGKLALSNEALGRRVGAILEEYFKVAEVSVRTSFDPRELRQSLNVFSYIAQSLRDAEARTRQAKVDQSVNSLMNAIEQSIKTAEASARIRLAQIRELPQRPSQPMLQGAPRVAGLLLPEPPGRYRSSRAVETQADLFARREREARMRSALREQDVMGGGAGRPALVATGGGGAGAPPVDRPPSGGMGGFGGAGGFGRALAGVNLPGAGVVREIGNEFAMATKQVLLFGTAYKALAFATSFPAQVGEAVGALQSFNNTLKAITPTAQEAAASNQFILDIVDRYNVPLKSARDGFTKLYASMAPAGFKGDEIRALFTGVSQAAATFGMSADKVDRVNYAFAQMASKGQVMSEELKGQLGDVLPGAMGIFAKAAGFEGPQAIEKFSKALEDGAYKGDSMRALLKNVTVVLTKEFGPGAEGAARTFQGVINRMQNSTKLLYEAFEPVAVGFLNAVVVPMTSGIKVLSDGFSAFFKGVNAQTTGGFAIAKELERLRPAFEGIRANVVNLLPTLQSLGEVLLGASKAFLQIASNPFVGYLAKIYINVLALSLAIQVLNLRALIPMIANFARSAVALIAFTAQCARAGQSAQVMGLMVRTAGLTLRTFFASSGVGLVLVGVGLLIEKFMSMNQALEDTKRKAQDAGQSIRSMSQIEARQAAQQYGSSTRSLQQLNKQIEEGQTKGRAWIEVTKQQADALKEAGINVSNVRGSLQVQPERVPGAFQKLQQLEAEALYRERQVKFEGQPSQASAALTAIPASSEAGKAGSTAGKQKSLESYYGLADQLAKAASQAEIERIQNEFDYKYKTLNSFYDLQESRANSFQRLTISFQKELLAIEQRRQKATLDAALAVKQAKESVADVSGGLVGGMVPTGGGVVAKTGGAVSQNPLTRGRSTGPHLHAQAAGITERTLQYLVDKYLEVGGKVASAFGRSRGAAGHGYNAIDFLTPQDTPIKLKPGASISQYGPAGGRGGLMAQVSTPEGSFQLGHLTSLMPQGGVPAGAPRPVPSSEKRDELAKQQEQLALQAQRVTVLQAEKIAAEETAIALTNYTASIAPVAEQELQNSLLQERIRLMKTGLSGDILDSEMKSFELTEKIRVATKMLTAAQDENNKKVAEGLLGQDTANRLNAQYLDGINKLNAVRPQAIKLIQDETMAKQDLNFETARSSLESQIRLAGAFTSDAEARVRLAEQFPGDIQQQNAILNLENQLQSAQRLKEGLQSIASTLGESFGNAFSSIITGASTVQEALAGMFKSISDSFAKMVADMISKWITTQALQGFQRIFSAALPALGAAGFGGNFDAGIAPLSNIPSYSGAFATAANGAVWQGGFQAFASGGIVTGPTMGLVGEGRYNEAIVPLPDGKSIPVDLGGGAGASTTNVIVNVDAKGTNAQGNEDVARQLGGVISVAVQSEIVRQQRPGGLLASSR
jgi:tape measure domain-containing protein